MIFLSSVLNAQKLDKDVVYQLKSKGKDPHFGQESPFQSTGACVWSSYVSLGRLDSTPVLRYQTLLFAQYALVLLGEENLLFTSCSVPIRNVSMLPES